MRKILVRSFGGPEVLELVEADRPTPGPGQVLVEVRAIGVNPADWKLRAGWVPKYGTPPFTPGLDFSGVTGAGHEVYGVAFPTVGSYAEYIAVSVDALAPKPTSVDFEHAAALPTAALTAYQPLVDVQPGQRVLVHGAAGGVGHLAVQILKARGAYVLGTARAGKHPFLRDLGLDEPIDYTTADFSELRDIDVVLDTVGYGPKALAGIKPGGHLIDVVGSGTDRSDVIAAAAERDVRFEQFGFRPSGGDLADIAKLVDSGQVRVAVEQVLPLAAAAEAHELSESGRVRGKLVLTP